jgi:hypothetical protein
MLTLLGSGCFWCHWGESHAGVEGLYFGSQGRARRRRRGHLLLRLRGHLPKAIQGTFVMIQGIFIVIQGTFVVSQGTFVMIQ